MASRARASRLHSKLYPATLQAVLTPHQAHRRCVVCLSAPRETRFDCGHACCCAACSAVILAETSARGPLCPNCRAQISGARSGPDAGGVEIARQPTFERIAPPAPWWRIDLGQRDTTSGAAAANANANAARAELGPALGLSGGVGGGGGVGGVGGSVGRRGGGVGGSVGRDGGGGGG
eukprot:scaffold85016_cov71-Phaeocystis_antarctica.AAC.2